MYNISKGNEKARGNPMSFIVLPTRKNRKLTCNMNISSNCSILFNS